MAVQKVASGARERVTSALNTDLTAQFRELSARGRNAAWRFPVTLAVALAISIGLGLAIGFGLLLAHQLPTDLAEQMRNPTRPATFFLTTGVVFGALLVGFAAAIRLVHGKRVADVVGPWSWPRFGLGLAIWSVVLCGLSLADLALAPHGFAVSAAPSTAGLALWALLGLAPQTFAEEFVFRGYLTQGLLNATRSPMAAAVVSGLLFGALHVPNGWPQAANATLFGVLLALLAIRTGGLAFTFGLHLANNWFGAVVVVSAGDVFHGVPAIFTQTTPQLMWWDVVASTLALSALTWAISRAARGAVTATPDAPGQAQAGRRA